MTRIFRMMSGLRRANCNNVSRKSLCCPGLNQDSLGILGDGRKRGGDGRLVFVDVSLIGRWRCERIS